MCKHGLCEGSLSSPSEWPSQDSAVHTVLAKPDHVGCARPGGSPAASGSWAKRVSLLDGRTTVAAGPCWACPVKQGVTSSGPVSPSRGAVT